MSELDNVFAELEQAAADPARAFERYASPGQKAIGCIPYFAPCELVHAAGMYPVELWGGDIEIAQAGGYYPAFYCSILVTLMERALRGEYDFISGVIVPATCDGLRNLGQNWQFGMKGSNVKTLVQPIRRDTPAAEQYYLTELHQTAEWLEDIAGGRITEHALHESIRVYNRQRAAMRGFDAAVARHLDAVTPWMRHVAFAAARTMPPEEHTKLIEQATAALDALPEDAFDGIRLVTTGILIDSKPLLDELEHRGIRVVGDVVTAESVRFAKDAPGNVDPFASLAHIWLDIADTSVSLDVTKHRGVRLVELVRERKADGVLVDVTKFCEEEEYDYPVLKIQMARENIPVLHLETAEQNHINEQATTRIQAFAEMLG